MRIVYRASHIIDANLVKGVLESEGLFAFVSGEHLIGAVGRLPACDLVAVMVSDSDVERALPIVRELDAQFAQAAVDAAREDGRDAGGMPQPA